MDELTEGKAMTPEVRARAEEVRVWLEARGEKPHLCTDPRHYAEMKCDKAYRALEALFYALDDVHEHALAADAHALILKLIEVAMEFVGERPTLLKH